MKRYILLFAAVAATGAPGCARDREYIPMHPPAYSVPYATPTPIGNEVVSTPIRSTPAARPRTAPTRPRRTPEHLPPVPDTGGPFAPADPVTGAAPRRSPLSSLPSGAPALPPPAEEVIVPSAPAPSVRPDSQLIPPPVPPLPERPVAEGSVSVVPPARSEQQPPAVRLGAPLPGADTPPQPEGPSLDLPPLTGPSDAPEIESTASNPPRLLPSLPDATPLSPNPIGPEEKRPATERKGSGGWRAVTPPAPTGVESSPVQPDAAQPRPPLEPDQPTRAKPSLERRANPTADPPHVIRGRVKFASR